MIKANQRIGIVFSLLLTLLIASSSQANANHSTLNDLACIKTPSTQNLRLDFEKNIRRRVRFEGELESPESLQSLMQKAKAPALSVAVIKAGAIDWSAVYIAGGNQPKLNCDTLFQAASLSKPVTMMAAMRLAEQGHIDLKKDIREYLKSYALGEGKQTPTDRVTFDNLLGHYSGVRGGGYEGYPQTKHLPNLIDIARGENGTNTPAIEVVATPNLTLNYSGAAYTLAAIALQDHSRQPFAALMQKWVLAPVKMRSSSFAPITQIDKNQNIARGHLNDGNEVPGGWNHYPELSAAGMWSTPKDLAKFMVEIYQGLHGKSQIFPRHLVENLISNPKDGHVYGFHFERSGEHVFLTHYGGTRGYGAGMTIDLASGDGMAYQINSDNSVDLGERLLLTASSLYHWQQFKQAAYSRRAIDAQVLQQFAGKYQWNESLMLEAKYRAEDQQLTIFFPNGDSYPLVAIQGGEQEFVHSETGIKVSFPQVDGKQGMFLYGRMASRID